MLFCENRDDEAAHVIARNGVDSVRAYGDLGILLCRCRNVGEIPCRAVSCRRSRDGAVLDAGKICRKAACLGYACRVDRANVTELARKVVVIVADKTFVEEAVALGHLKSIEAAVGLQSEVLGSCRG